MMDESYSSDEENREYIRQHDLFLSKKVKAYKPLKLKNVSYCTYFLRRGSRVGQRCNKFSKLADGLCSVHRRNTAFCNVKKVNFNRLKKSKRYNLIRCIDKDEPIVILGVDNTLMRVRLPRSLKPIPIPKKNYLCYSRLLPDGKVFAMWKRCEN